MLDDFLHGRPDFLLMQVIPGPCGFLRRSAVSDEILSEVRRIVSNPTERDSLIQGNLKARTILLLGTDVNNMKTTVHF